MSQTGTILDRIVEVKRERLKQVKATTPLAAVRQAAEAERAARARGERGGQRDFIGALTQTKPGFAVIAELKRASPSAGVICNEWDPVGIVSAYEQHGARAISVLTEEAHFQGDPAYLRLARETVNLPLLRKDFIVEPYQVYESLALGADALLLIVAVLEQPLLRDLFQLAGELGLAALVEVHTEAELERALALGAHLVGINNRDLHTFTTSLDVTRRLAPRVPKEAVVVTESGIRTHDDLLALAPFGVRAALVGEHLLRGGAPGEALQALVRGKE